MKDKLAFALLLSGAVSCSIAHGQATLPVYRVTKAGASRTELEALSSRFKMPSLRATGLQGGQISVMDTSRFLALPTSEAQNAGNQMEKLRNGTVNKFPSIPIELKSIDMTKLNRLRVFSEDAAIKTATEQLRAAGLEPQFGTPAIGHNFFTLFSERNGRWVSNEKPVDTSVIYVFTDPTGHRIIGPGAQVQVTFDGDGNVSRLHYAANRLKEEGTVRVISGQEADRRIRKIAPGGGKISKRLVYWCPPLQPLLPDASQSRSMAIVPWYAYTTTSEVRNAKTGAASMVKSRVQMIPATDDPRYVPTATVEASASGAEVQGRVSIRGGTGPYTVIWGSGTSSIVNGQGGWATGVTSTGDVRYTAARRWTQNMARNRGLSLDRTETVSATVIDANGVSVQASTAVQVRARPLGLEESNPELFALLHPSGPAFATPTYGCFNPADPGKWTSCRVGWQSSMFAPGAGSGTQRFCWMGDDAWPGDFVRHNPVGTLPSQPWVNGDADYSNWGVNTADLVLHIGDGNSDGFTQMQPGAPLADYATSWVAAPAYMPTVSINGNGYGTPASYNVNYNNSWGPTGGSATLEWLLMDDCDTHDPTGGGGLNMPQRWGPAFNGLHVFTGFSTTENGNGPFERDVAGNLLGLHGAPQSIVQSWFNSSLSNGTGEQAAFGPAVQISIFVFSDLNDFYWGKGSVGPTIVPSQWPAPLLRWWYMRGSNPAALIP